MLYQWWSARRLWLIKWFYSTRKFSKHHLINLFFCFIIKIPLSCNPGVCWSSLRTGSAHQHVFSSITFCLACLQFLLSFFNFHNPQSFFTKPSCLHSIFIPLRFPPCSSSLCSWILVKVTASPPIHPLIQITHTDTQMSAHIHTHDHRQAQIRTYSTACTNPCWLLCTFRHTI